MNLSASLPMVARVLWTAALAHGVLALVLSIAALVDTAELLGIGRWVKPLKFAISIGVFTGTMAWLTSYFVRPVPRGVSIAGVLIAVAMSGEMVLIAGQALRGVQSHFNADTPLDAAIFRAMGIMIVLNTLAVAYIASRFAGRHTTIRGAHLLGVQLGLVVFVLASLEGFLMVSLQAHSVGGPDGGPGLPFVNWSTQVGDLRVAHFVGMHALQGLPILGWLLDRSGVAKARGAVAMVAAAWLAVSILLAWLALAGQPLLRL